MIEKNLRLPAVTASAGVWPREWFRGLESARKEMVVWFLDGLLSPCVNDFAKGERVYKRARRGKFVGCLPVLVPVEELFSLMSFLSSSVREERSSSLPQSC